MACDVCKSEDCYWPEESGPAPEVGGWVKIPGLDPSETNALNYLSIDQLNKLRIRVEDALMDARRKIAALREMREGVEVVTKRTFGNLPAGSRGIVLDRESVHGAEYVPDEKVPVVFPKFGQGWVPVTNLEVTQ